ncbi:alpha-(1,3)-fucosyltransferase 10 isoform X1 [Dermacentor andersoni]|uniref:alpha-(1,3)-fucosyltransferase 10 isoform X1 n=1 Tax=Dermacentor andersoni TaxID=34620 RepID=UPI00215595B5|nr:alpha-(1,3)-fucosyltransferase 10-like isoform X1 [Dermacentor andersoni]
MVAVCAAKKFRSRRFLVRTSLILLTLALFSCGFSYFLISNAENDPLFYGHYRTDHSHYTGSLENVSDPIILWWTPFTKQAGHTKTCGNKRCFFTEDRIFFNHTNLQAVMFYGSELEIGDLPLPRKTHHDWALLHEESPKNNFIFCMSNVLRWFNHTSTFRRNSDLPLTLQYLNYIADLTSKEFFVETSSKTRARANQSLIAYVQSDCNTPIERDSFVSELMNYVSIDSYGKCLHNKDLPKELANAMDAMDNKAFWHLLASYKFHIAIENYVCEDYITEKLWRPLIVGSVPIYFGSPSVVDWLPNYADSAILIANYSSPKELAEAIKKIDGNDMLYESFLGHKMHSRVINKALLSAMKNRRWGVNDHKRPSFVEEFECLICSRVWRRLRNPGIENFIANASHYSCDMPQAMLKRPGESFWKQLYRQANTEAKVLEDLLLANVAFGEQDVQNRILSLLQAGSSHLKN